MQKEHTIKFESIESYDHLDEMEKMLFDKAMKFRDLAYAPYSDFTVGCAILLENGEIITGSNQENAAYPSGLCAERTTIFYTGANYPDVKIKKLFVIGAPRNATSSVPIPPCGACRQSILEYEAKQNEEIEIYFASLGGAIYKTKSIRELLPFSFDSSYL
ncbi:cytidine deaminase [Kaistella polysaccharea]|uniref:cytidine deaminase n=1 Tax=Kaistella polysaccharea TaxID=2878534 RepID=UPI001CF1C43B|nr:cytidine deaminase [Kaistella polysaccharea]